MVPSSHDPMMMKKLVDFYHQNENSFKSKNINYVGGGWEYQFIVYFIGRDLKLLEYSQYLENDPSTEEIYIIRKQTNNSISCKETLVYSTDDYIVCDTF